MEDVITIIIPVYNVQPYLDRCMQSVLNQTYKNIEIIIVDDKSNDNSNQMCLKYLKDTRVTVRHGINEGLSAARNIGLDIAKGTFVLFVDSDDYIEPDMIENLYMCQKKTGADTVIGGFKRVINGKIITLKNKCSGVIYEKHEEIKNNVLKKMLGCNGIDQIEMSVWKVLFSMDIIRANTLRFPDKKYLCEDIIFDFSYYPLCSKVAMCNDTGYCYCLNEESLSQSYMANKFERLKFQTLEMKKRAMNIDFDEDAFLRIDNFFLGNSIHHMKTMAANVRKIGRRQCILAYRDICTSEEIKSIRWDKIASCYTGKERVSFELVKNNKVYVLYLYLRILTTVRQAVRG